MCIALIPKAVSQSGLLKKYTTFWIAAGRAFLKYNTRLRNRLEICELSIIDTNSLIISIHSKNRNISKSEPNI